MPDPVLWPLEASTEAKHRLYRRYLDAWWPIMLQMTQGGFTRPRVTYVDAFAGPGEYAGGEEGSPVFALDRLLNHAARERMGLGRDRVVMVFIEDDARRHAHLSDLLVRRFGPLCELPVTVEVRHGRAERDTIPILTELNAWGSPILAVFDSWGNVGVPLTTIGRIADNPSSESIVTFGPNWFNRREGQDPEKLDLIFGGERHWRPTSSDMQSTERWSEWLETYRAALKRAGHEFPLTFEVRPRTGIPLYLVYGTGHRRGVEVFKDAMWDVDTTDGMAFCDPRTTAAKAAQEHAGQLSFFWDPDAPAEELVGLVLLRLEQGQATLDEISDYLVLETSRWRGRDARPAVQHLLKEGNVNRVPDAGALKRDTMLRLAR